MANILAAQQQRIRSKLALLYGAERADALWPRLEAVLAAYEARPSQVSPSSRLTEQDVVLITYGDLIQQSGQRPLRMLHTMLQTYLADVVNTVHILPFFPYSSDDGFSVIDYLAVDEALGDWADIHRLRDDFRLMFDAVINHISAQSAWFKQFAAGESAYQDYFIITDPAADLSDVVRPRTLPLLTPVETAAGQRHVWTTFSPDQIDLNYASEDVLLAVIDVLLAYVRHGASLIRLDAIAYLWKEIGTSCIHLPETHAVVQLIRDVLDVVAPDVLIITETNVPHDENVSYFGDGANEAQLVYQFSLPPLVLHSFRVGNALALTDWASTLEKVSETTTFFNFTASHDGIGVRPATGLISDEDIVALTELAEARGGQVSYKTNNDGSQSPYELNVTYVDAIIGGTQVDPGAQARRFLASQAIMLAFAGVPGIYFHSLLGSRNWTEGVEKTGRARSINREKLAYEDLVAELKDPQSLRYHVFTRYSELIRIRTAHHAFHPNGEQVVLNLNDSLFSILRVAPDGTERIVAMHNVSGKMQTISLKAEDVGIESIEALHDLISDERFEWRAGLTLTLDPFEVMWLVVE